MRRNSVLDELRVSRLAVIQEEICFRTLRSVTVFYSILSINRLVLVFSTDVITDVASSSLTTAYLTGRLLCGAAGCCLVEVAARRAASRCEAPGDQRLDTTERTSHRRGRVSTRPAQSQCEATHLQSNNTSDQLHVRRHDSIPS